MKYVAPGERARCPSCGVEAPVPETATRVEDAVATTWREQVHSKPAAAIPSAPPPTRERIPSWLLGRPLLAGLVPPAMSVLALLLWPALNWGASAAAAIAANLLVGWIVGRAASRRRFFFSTGLAAAGWVASLLAFYLISVVTHSATSTTDAQGLLIFAAFTVSFGLFTSPLAGFASGAGRAREGVTPAGVS